MDMVDGYGWWIFLMDMVDGHSWCILMGYAKKNAGSWYVQPFKIGILIDGMWMGIQWDMSPTISNLGVSENAGYPKVAMSTGIIMRNLWSEPVVPPKFPTNKKFRQHARHPEGFAVLHTLKYCKDPPGKTATGVVFQKLTTPPSFRLCLRLWKWNLQDLMENLPLKLPCGNQTWLAGK